MSKCGCKPNMYCVLNDQSCSSCARHRSCKAGYGVSQPGTSRKFSFIMKIRNKSLKKCFGFPQERLPQTWDASGVQKGRSLTKTPAQTPVSRIKGAVEGLLKWAMPLRTLCVNLGRLSQICDIQPQQKRFQPQAPPWSWALTQRRPLQTRRPPSAFLLQRGFLTTPQQGQWWAWSLTGI